MKNIFICLCSVCTVLLCSVCTVSCTQEKPDNGGENGELGKVNIAIDTVGDTFVTYTISSPTDADIVAWQLLGGDESVPEAADIIANGVQINGSVPTTTRTEDTLTPVTSYKIVAAASRGDEYSEVTIEEFTTEYSVPVPEISIDSTLRRTRSSATFSFSYSELEKAAYVCVVQGGSIPTAEEIVADGNPIELENGEFTVEDLSPSMRYTVIIAGSIARTIGGKDSTYYSNSSRDEFKTLDSYLYDQDMENIKFTELVEISAAANEVALTLKSDDGKTISLELNADIQDGKIAAGDYTVSTRDEALETTIPAGKIRYGIVYGAADYDPSYITIPSDGENPDIAAITAGQMTINDDGTFNFSFAVNNYFVFTGSSDVNIEVKSAVGSTMTEDITDVKFAEDATFSTYRGSSGGHRYVRLRVDDSEKRLNLEIYYEDDTTYPTGTIEANTGEYKEKTFITGYVDGFGENKTYLLMKGDPEVICPATAGTVDIIDNGDGTYTIDFQLYDDQGYEFSGSYTGELS